VKILTVHNLYQQPGGEDSVFLAETNLLRDAGHDVETLQVSNDEIVGFLAKSGAALSAVYNWRTRKILTDRLEKEKFDILHAHNFFPKLSPSIFDAARSAGVASVLTLHNFRLTCAAGTLFRNGAVCQQCLHKPAFPAVTNRCYRGSLAGSASVAAMIQIHKAVTWRRKVDRFIALSSFAIEVFSHAGIPRERIRVKPNFVPDCATPEMMISGDANGRRQHRNGFVFVGRLSPEKGCDTLIEAWRGIEAPLTLIGDGPELDTLRASAPANVTFAGRQSAPSVKRAMENARAVIVPSRWYETFGLVAVEAMMNGTPVIASRIGALPDIVEHEVTGLLVEPGDVAGLRHAILRLAHDCDAIRSMGAAGRLRYEARYTPHRNIDMLEHIYAEAIASRDSDAS